jgi:hypothetical protein
MNKQLEDLLETANYDDQRSIYQKLFTSGIQTSGKLKNKLDLIMLLCLVSQKMSVDNKTVTPKDVIEKIIGKVLNYNDPYDHYLIGLSIVCDDMMFGVSEVDSLGLKTSGEIVSKIKTILAEWLPF